MVWAPITFSMAASEFVSAVDWLTKVGILAGATLVVCLFQPAFVKRFVNPFDPQTADEKELQKVHAFIGVDNRPKGPLELGDEQKDRITKNRELFRKESCLYQKDNEKFKDFKDFESLHFPPSYGTLGLIRQTAGQALKRIDFLVTQQMESKQKDDLEKYTKILLTALDIANGDTVIRHEYAGIEIDVEGLRSLFERVATKSAKDLEGRLAIDTTGGTALHTLAAAKASEGTEALIIYNNARVVRDRERCPSLQLVEV